LLLFIVSDGSATVGISGGGYGAIISDIVVTITISTADFIVFFVHKFKLKVLS